MLHGCDRVVAIVAVVLVSLASAASAAADTRTWSGSSGSWHDPGNWDEGFVPTPDDDAVITGGVPTITSADATVGSIVLSTNLQIDSDRTLTILGPATSTWSDGNIVMSGAATVVNAGTLQITGDDDFVTTAGGAGPFRFRNTGVVESSGAREGIVAELENDGILRVLAGSFSQSGSVASPPESNGEFVADGELTLANVLMGSGAEVSGTGTVRFAGGTSTIDAAGYALAGTTALSGSGVLVFNGDGSTGALRSEGLATRRGTGTLTVGSGASRLGDSVTFTDAGVTAFSPGSSTVIDGPVQLLAPVAGHTLRLNGDTTWAAGTITVFDAGTVENAGNLQIVGDDVHVDISVAGGVPGQRVFHNLVGGRVERNPSNPLAPASGIGTELENDGTIRVLSGALVQSWSVPSPPESNGAFEAQGTGVLSLSNVLMGPGSTVSGSGTVRFAGGPSTVNTGGYVLAGTTSLGSSGELVLNGSGSTGALRFDGLATRRGTGTLTVGSGASRLGESATFADAGVTAFTAGSQLSIDGPVQLMSPVAGHTLRLNGATHWSDGNIAIFDAGAVENAGNLEVSGADVHVTTSTAGGAPGPDEFHNLAGGAIRVLAGAKLGTGPGLTVDGGVVGGDGTLDGSVANLGGTVAPGSSPGTLTITGNYMQGPGGRLRAEIAGAHDRLQVGGVADLGGTLELVTLGGFDPSPADTFRVLDAASRTGAFATVSGAQATQGKRYLASYDATGVTLGIGLGPANAAPPSIPSAGAPGDLVTCDPGAWTGSPAFAYTWLRDGAPVGTGQTYTLVAADGGRTVVCRVTATNANGSADAMSNGLAVRVLDTDPSPPPPPETGETFNVQAERGKVTVRLPDGRTVLLDETVQIETGSVVDTREGAVRLFAEGRGGEIDSGVFSDGLFRVTQSKGSRPVTELRLVEKLTGCPRRGKSAAAARKRRRKKRRLWGDATGEFRTRGEYGNGINDATKWLTEDRCDGTFFRVKHGVVRVRRNGQRKAVRVRAGESYLVRRRP